MLSNQDRIKIINLKKGGISILYSEEIGIDKNKNPTLLLFNGACVWVRDGGVFRIGGRHTAEACVQALGADASGLLRLLRVSSGRGSIP